MMAKYISFDLEMPNQKARISAIGITVIENGEVVNSFYSLVNPKSKFDPFIVDLVGITPEMVEDKPTFPEIWEQVKDMMSDGILVAYNAPSDLRILSRCLKHYKIEWKQKVEYICTYYMGQICYPELEKHGLDSLCEHLDINLEHHNAGSDSYGCAMLLLDYIKNGMDPKEYIKVYDTEKQRTVKNRNKVAPVKKKLSFIEKLELQLFNKTKASVKKKTVNRLPYIDPQAVIGIDKAAVAKTANNLIKSNQAADFAKLLPHKYHEENNIHALIISKRNKFKPCIEMIDSFLPYVDNIETCDLIKPKLFKKQQPELKDVILRWISSENKFSIAMGLNILNEFYVNTEHLLLFLDAVKSIKCNYPPIKTKTAAFLVLALESDFDITYPYLTSDNFSKKVLNKVVTIALKNETYSDDQKAKLEFVASNFRAE